MDAGYDGCEVGVGVVVVRVGVEAVGEVRVAGERGVRVDVVVVAARGGCA